MKQISCLLLIFYVLNSICQTSGNSQYVTCGSIAKLFNAQYDVRLHSHDVKYGSGSAQQSVTGTKVKEDHNSNWRIKGLPKKPCQRGQRIQCGQQVRLEHVATRRNLHSHHFSSPLSDQQEVSCFGENGEGDTGDFWTIECDGDGWRRDERVGLKHIDTGMYLSVSSHVYGRPISGQNEVVGASRSGGAARWETRQGVFIAEGGDLPAPSPSHEEL